MKPPHMPGRGNRKQRCATDDANDARRAELRLQCFTLRVTKQLTEVAIAAEVGLNVKTVRKYVEEAIRERACENVDEMRAFSNAALSEVLAGHIGRARGGCDKSAGVVIKAIAAHAKINGYEAPSKQELSGPKGSAIEIKSAQDDILSRLARLAQPE